MKNTPTLEIVLKELKKKDGELWIRILGQNHYHYNELPFWVLIEDEKQITRALPYLQQKLRGLQSDPDADVTVSFISFHDNKKYSYGMFKGEDFFDKNAYDNLYDEPTVSSREKTVFDYEYPGDPWALR